MLTRTLDTVSSVRAMLTRTLDTVSSVRCTMAEGHVERGQRLHQYVDDRVTVRWPHEERS
jgi:hypothetical protein